MFSIIETKPSIIFAISITSFFAQNLNYQYTKAAKTILEYINNLKQQNIIYKSQDKLCIKRYFDFNLAKDKKS